MKFRNVILREAWEQFVATDQTDIFIDVFDYQVESLKLTVKSWLKEQALDESLVGSINGWIGGSEYCQCAGCAKPVNHIKYLSAGTLKPFLSCDNLATMLEDPDGIVIEIDFDIDDAIAWANK